MQRNLVRGAVGAALCVITTVAVRSQSFETVTTAALRQDVSAVEALASGTAPQEFVPGELLVQFRPGVSPSAQASALRVLRAQPGPDATRWIGDTLHLRGIGGDDPERAAAVLQLQPEVLFAQPNYIRQLHSTPNDPEYARQWNMDAVNMPLAWEINSGAGAGVVVAVLDSGLTTAQGTYGFRVWNGAAFGVYGVPFSRTADFDHARVRTGAEFTPTGDWRAGNQIVLFDAVGHGTHVAGTIAQQTNNRNGYAGIANGATILPVKVCFGAWDVQLALGAMGVHGRVRGDEGGCADADVAAGIRYAVDNGAKVINMSLGGPQPTPITLAALRYAVQRGVFVSISAGNSAREGNPTNYPAAYATQLDGVVAVAAVTRSQSRAVYSSHGPYVEIAAPGGAGVSGSSEDVWQVVPNGDDLSVRWVAPAFNRYVGGSKAGTSMAAPHVAGVAALLYSQGITNPGAIESALKQFAKDLGAPGQDNEYGYGLIDARASLRGLGVAR